MVKTGKIPGILTLAMAFCFVMVSLVQPQEKARSLKRVDNKPSPRFAIYEESEEKLSIPQSAEITREAREEIRLEGVASTDGVYRAVVNDEIVGVGSIIKGYEIIGISRQGIVVEHDGYWAWIPLEKGFD